MDNDKSMENLITGWGLPGCLERNKEHIIFKFDDESLMGTGEKGYHCKVRNVKFCLYNVSSQMVIFSMDFFISNFPLSGKPSPRIELELIHVHDAFSRGKGVASYYFDRIREYALEEKAKCIYVRPDANAKNFKNDSKLNALSQSDLELFYKRRSTPEMPVFLEF